MLDKLFEFLAKFGRLFLFWYICDPYQGGVVLRLGLFNRLLRPGFNWIWPFQVEHAIACSTVAETMMVGPQSLTTTDGQHVVISSVITFEIVDPKVYLLEIQGMSRVIEDSTYGVVSENVTKRSWETIRTMDLAAELTKDVRRFAKRYGVNVIRVQIGDLTTTRSIRLMQSITNAYAPSKDI